MLHFLDLKQLLGVPLSHGDKAKGFEEESLTMNLRIFENEKHFIKIK